MRFFGSSAPAIGAGPAGQLDSLRVPARMAAAKLVASFFGRPATSFGLMLSLAAATPEVPAGAAAADTVVGSAGVAVSVAGAALVPAGVGVAATSPPLTPERGASATQAVRTASERAPRRVE